MGRFEECLAPVLKYEGGFSAHPDDKGGATNYGITQTVYDKYRKEQKKPVQSVKLIDGFEVHAIYRENYWKPSRAAYLQSPLDLVVFDTAVNFGVGRSNQFLGEVFGFEALTIWNLEVSKIIHHVDPSKVALGIIALRMEWRGRRVVQDPTQAVFLKGWLNRDRDLFDRIVKWQ